MTNNRIALLTSLEQMRDEIYDECQRSAFASPREYRQCCGRILNAATILYEDTLGAIEHNSETGAKTKLPLFDLIELQQKVLSVLQEPESILNKEKMMQEYFAKQNVPPKNYFRATAKITELLPTA